VVRCLAFLALGLFFICGAPADAASSWENVADPVFIHNDASELPDSAVMAVAQDTAGFLWVGTQGGLARYDGYHFRKYLPDPNDSTALPDGYVRALLADANGGLWIGSSSNGLVHFDASSERFHTWQRDPAGRTGPRSAVVDALAYTGDGDLWVGGDQGLSRFDPRTNAFVPVPLTAADSQPRIWAILVDRAGSVWVGAQSGLFVRRAGQRTFAPFVLRDGMRFDAHAVTSIYEDHARRLWVGSLGTLAEIDPRRTAAMVFRSGDAASSLAAGPQWSITEMVPDVVWVGTDAAISIVDVRAQRVRRVQADTRNPAGLPAGKVVQFLHDRSGLVWLADHVGGLLTYNPLSHGLYQLPATQSGIGLENGAITLAAARDGVLAGGFDGRLVHLQPHPLRVSGLKIPNRGAVQMLYPVGDGSLWIGMTTGLCRLAAGADTVTCPPWPANVAVSTIYALLQDDRELWIGTGAGILIRDPSGAMHAFSGNAALTNKAVRVLFRDRRNQLWACTENGLDRIDPSGHVTRFSARPGDPDSIGPGAIASLLEDRYGRLWAAGSPLDIFPANDAPGPVRRLGVADGLPHENVDGLAEDPAGRIWASTDKSIAVIDPATLHVRGLGVADGVSENGYWASAVSRAADGTIFFGGVDGITVVTPGAGSPWTYAPPVVVTALSIGRRNVPSGRINLGDGGIDLPADARDFSVEFSALDYSAPQALRYEYRLDGYDVDWVHADPAHRIATYTNLSPGNYTLEVRGTNRLGVFSNRVLQLRVNALPLWYETWWFRASLIALIALIAYGTLRVRTAVLRRRQHELEALVGERTVELSEANAKLRELSLSDPLTGLRNRRFLDQHLESDIALTLRRYDNWIAGESAELPVDADVLFFLIDLDNFKIVNDRFGHRGGDAILMQMRERLLEVFRESDFVVRWGGDEFLTVARGSTRADAPLLAERIRHAIAGRPFTLTEGRTVDVSVSIGFAAFPFVIADPDAVTWFQVVALADQALYMAKQEGRNAWTGLAASADTDPLVVCRRIEGSADDLVRAAVLEVLSRDATSAGQTGSEVSSS